MEVTSTEDPKILAHCAKAQEMAEYFAADSVTITVSSSDKTSALENVKDFILRLIKGHKEQSRKIEITGKTEDEVTEILDLLRGRVVTETEVTSNSRRIPYIAYRDALRTIWYNQSDDLVSRVSKK